MISCVLAQNSNCKIHKNAKFQIKYNKIKYNALLLDGQSELANLNSPVEISDLATVPKQKSGVAPRGQDKPN